MFLKIIKIQIQIRKYFQKTNKYIDVGYPSPSMVAATRAPKLNVNFMSDNSTDTIDEGKSI